ncbi:MAG: orotate phosphoribosyltransferase [Candidatus Omnitrophica bacterium]|nr:orotate phosphoribosyltransferase [Candidatus Omnitrophota bacterium]MDD5429784.1 orotate phosphoribosyltransferase [Candidatus Omnitrophota bacterium]
MKLYIRKGIIARYLFLKYNLCMNINDTKQQLLLLLKEKSFFREKITLSSGKSSDYYIDVRKVSLSPAGVYYISHLVWDIIKDDNPDAIGGPTLGADPIVSGVCFLAHENNRKIKGFLIRKTPKKHGRQKLIEGEEILPGDETVIVDDVATSGSSFVKTIEVLRQEKIKVLRAIAVVDRQDGAAEALARLNCPFTSLFTKSDFIE